MQGNPCVHHGLDLNQGYREPFLAVDTWFRFDSDRWLRQITDDVELNGTESADSSTPILPRRLTLGCERSEDCEHDLDRCVIPTTTCNEAGNRVCNHPTPHASTTR